jgi:predicted metal-dependent phosphoesterase TrpH
MSVKGIINRAKKSGIDVVSITDHGTIKGSLEATEYVKNNNCLVQIIKGAEYYTSHGDIIGLFINEEIEKFEANEVIEEIHKQGGLAVLPHPYKDHNLTKALLEKIDIVEVFNSRCSTEENDKALRLAKRYNKPIIFGSDAHLYNELNLTYNLINYGEPVKESITKIQNGNKEYSNKKNVIISQIKKGIKRRKLKLVLKKIKSLLSYYKNKY